MFGLYRMKSKKRIIGVLCIIFAALPPHMMYAMSEDGNLWNIHLFSMMLIASVLSFAVFIASRFLFVSKSKWIIAGIFFSYSSILALLITVSAITGDLSETIMWMPVILMFGIPYMAPLVGIALLGNMLIFEDKIKKPEQNT